MPSPEVGRVIRCVSCGAYIALTRSERVRRVIKAHRKVCPRFKTLFPVRKASGHLMDVWR